MAMHGIADCINLQAFPSLGFILLPSLQPLLKNLQTIEIDFLMRILTDVLITRFFYLEKNQYLVFLWSMRF